MTVDSELALIPAAGIACLWLASRLRIPAILLLLPVGVALGPGLGVLDPSELFGETLYPAVSLAVAFLLFEGGLGLRWDRLEGRSVVLRLVTVGVLVSFVTAASVASITLGVPPGVAMVLAAVLVVSGPTVVGPILAQVRPRQPTDAILRWEGIAIDPVGATLAIVIVNAVTAGERSTYSPAVAVLLTVAVGVVIGVAAGFGLATAIRRHWIDDHLQPVVALGVMIAAFALANALEDESGLFAATVLGVVLANQRRATVAHIAQFGESLGQVLLAVLFVVLGANVDVGALGDVLVPALTITAALVLVARPLGVALATAGSGLGRPDRWFMAWMAPRGIVAAATSSLFGLQLTDAGLDGHVVAPTAFVVIVVTVALYGLTARPVAQGLGIAREAPRGLIVLGAPAWVIGLLVELRAREVPVLTIATAPEEVERLERADLAVYDGRLEPDELDAAAEALGARQVLAAGSSAELDELGVAHYAESLGRANLFVVPAAVTVTSAPGRTRSVRARHAFDDAVTRHQIEERLAAGWRYRTVPAPLAASAGEELGLVWIRPDRTPEVLTGHTRDRARDGHVVVLAGPDATTGGGEGRDGSASAHQSDSA